MLKQKERKKKNTFVLYLETWFWCMIGAYTHISPPFSQHQSSTELMIQETTILSQWKYLSKPCSLNFCTIPSLNRVLRNFILEKLCVFFFPFFKLETKKKKKKKRETPTSIFIQAVNSLLPGCQKVLILEKKNGLAFSKFRDCSWTGKAKKVNDVGMS